MQPGLLTVYAMPSRSFRTFGSCRSCSRITNPDVTSYPGWDRTNDSAVVAAHPASSRRSVARRIATIIAPGTDGNRRAGWYSGPATVIRAAALLLLLLAVPCLAERRGPLEVELVAEHESVQPGASAWVGVRFRLDPGWHVYWRNSGDSGIPPGVLWDLPAGVEAGEILWPAPERIESGPFVMYGYEGEVLLMAELRVPRGAVTLGVGAKVDWQACDENTCVSDDAKLALEIAFAEGAPQGSRWGRLFEETRRLFPRPLPGAGATATDGAIELRLPLEARELSFFPFEEGVVEYRAPQRVLAPGVLALTPPRGAAPERLRGVVVAGAGAAREAYSVDAPVGRGAAPGPTWRAALAIATILVAGSLLVRRRRGENA